MLTPEIADLCKKASVKQNDDTLFYLITEINRLIDVRDKEPHKESAFRCEPVPKRQVANSKISAISQEVRPSYEEREAIPGQP
jgi:hypothetical protein